MGLKDFHRCGIGHISIPAQNITQTKVLGMEKKKKSGITGKWKSSLEDDYGNEV